MANERTIASDSPEARDCDVTCRCIRTGSPGDLRAIPPAWQLREGSYGTTGSNDGGPDHRSRSLPGGNSSGTPNVDRDHGSVVP